jgi:hypothetical protein
MNHERKPFDDKRVRRALTLALDRYEARGICPDRRRCATWRASRCRALPWATPPLELEKLAATGGTSGRRGRKRAGSSARPACPRDSPFTFKNRGIPMPYETVGIWLIDQWRQIGLNVKQEVVEAAAMVSLLRRGDFDVASDAQCSFAVEPDIDVQKFQSVGVSDNNYGRYKDPGPRRSLHESSRAPRIPRSASGMSAPSRSASSTRRSTTSTPCSGTGSSPYKRQGPGLDGDALTLPESAARRGVAGRVVALSVELARGERGALGQRGQLGPRDIGMHAPPEPAIRSRDHPLASHDLGEAHGCGRPPARDAPPRWWRGSPRRG